MSQVGNSPLSWWSPDTANHLLAPGDVLRARGATDEDIRLAITADPASYELVRVVALHTVRDVEEAVIQPVFGFGTNVSAAVVGSGGLLTAYNVLTESEVAELAAMAAVESTETDAEHTDVAAARAVLARAAREDG